MQTKTSPFIQKFTPYLRYVEIAGIVLSAAGLAWQSQDPSKGSEVIMVGFSTLGVAYYLYAFTLAPQNEGESAPTPKGFLDLLSVIVRKVSYIGCSVCIIGWLFEILHLNGSREMMLIGAATLAMTCLFSIIFIAGNATRLQQFQGFLVRGVPLLAATAYWLYLQPSITH